MAFAWRRPDRSGLCTGSRRKEVSVDVPVWREPEPRLGRPRRACLAGCPRGSESSEMVSPAVTRALRKSKTLRYGVPMLLLIVGGSFGLREFSQIRYDAVKIKMEGHVQLD
ncbi:uncharacterized protein LOC118634624 isoform X3 [Molossus molossus]|uniref:uncharacterized protein LOC118634624 isoform X3 n=1 Tax=Molossus molossus TaxID=27622 RepID=UPI0017469E94|nr:uncharacterized protein LOC118634624 isoform X3 [Molossus molossus]